MHYCGQRDEQERMQGVVRVVKPGSWIMEATFKDGKCHGLQRFIKEVGSYEISHYRDGVLHGSSKRYNADGSE